MSIKNIFNKIFSVKINTGVLEDTRPASEKNKDYSFNEVAITKGFSVGNLPTIPRSYKVRNQNGSGSCVAQSIAKMFEVLDTESQEAWSATPIYSRRSNRPQAGMIGWEALNSATKVGTVYENKIPSQLMSDYQMDNYPVNTFEMSKNRPSNYYIISDNNGKVKFEDLVQAIQQYNTAIIYVNASVSQWNTQPQVHTSDGTLRHAVACVDVIQYNKIPFIIIEDSWGTFLNNSMIPLAQGQRALSKEFIEKHCYFAGGLMSFKYETSIPPVTGEFSTILVFGDKGKEVERVQNKLKSLGLFPANIPSTGYYGEITRKAVYNFQIKYSVAPIHELDILKGKRIGSKTLEALNKN